MSDLRARTAPLTETSALCAGLRVVGDEREGSLKMTPSDPPGDEELPACTPITCDHELRLPGALNAPEKPPGRPLAPELPSPETIALNSEEFIIAISVKVDREATGCSREDLCRA